MRRVLLLMVALGTCLAAIAQPLHITGRVTDKATGQPLVGASVAVRESGRGASTGADGSYSLNVNAGQTLVFSHLGMQTQSIKVNASQTAIDVAMESDSQVIEDVVVIGYGVVRKRDLSGAVASIKSDDILSGNPVTGINNALQGKLAGVLVNQNDGAPGAGVSITIRGANSFSTSTQPLYIVDGVPFDVAGTPSSSANNNVHQSANPLAMINPNSIENVEVLKDASATAIYGSRGANGVIIITTKRGRQDGSDRIEFSSSWTIASVAKQIKMLDASTYASYINEQYLNDAYYLGASLGDLPYRGEWSYNYNGQTIIPSSGRYNASPEDYLNPRTVYDSYGNSYVIANTNWQDEIFRTGSTQEYNIMVSGGNAGGWHNFSGNYVNQTGVIYGSGYERYGTAMNIGRKVHDWIEIGMVLNYGHSKTAFTKSNAYDYSIIRSALIFPSNYPADMPASTSDGLDWLAANPALYVRTAQDHLTSNNIFTSSYINLTLTDYLSFRQNIGISASLNERDTYYGIHTQEGRPPVNSKAGIASNWWQGVTSESILTFNKTFDDIHALNAVVAFTYENGNYGSHQIASQNFPSDATGYNNIGLGLDYQQPHSGRGQSGLESILGRVNYVLSDKYIFTMSFRRDGSSKFAEGNKWANFWSGAAAWRASEEEFIKNLDIFDNLKLRASFGQTGNQGINDYGTLATLTGSNYSYSGGLTSGFAEPDWQAINPNLKWETTDQFNAGLDFGFLKGKINFTIDWYYKNTRDLLQRKTLPPSSGFQTMMINAGRVTNRGLELSGNFHIFTEGDFKWSIDANMSFNRNTIYDLESDMYATSLWYNAEQVFIFRNGLPIGAMYGYVEDGFYDNEAEVRANPKYSTSSDAVVKAMVGEIKYAYDADGNPVKHIIGNANPDFIYGLTNNFSYKSWNLSFFLQGTYGNDIFNGNLLDIKMANQGNITQSAYDHRWTSENRDKALWPRGTSDYTREWLLSDRYVEDGSYLRLKNLTLGYTFDNIKIKGISSINVYASASNLFTITKYSWYDPDVNAFGSDASRRGVDIYSYPSSRTFSLGVKITF